MIKTDAYKTPSSKLASSEGKIMVVRCNRLTGGTLLKILTLGSAIGFSTVLTITYSLSFMGTRRPNIEFYELTGLPFLDFVLFVLLGAVLQGFFVFFFVWIGLLIYSRFSDINIAVVRTQAGGDESSKS